MTERGERLLQQALALSVDERADVAAELIASLDETETGHSSEIDAAWAREIERRARGAMSGSSTREPWSAVRERMVERLADQ